MQVYHGRPWRPGGQGETPSRRPEPKRSPAHGAGPEPRVGSDLIDRVRHAIRSRNYSRRTEKAYLPWIRKYLRFHGNRPAEVLGVPEITIYLSTLATRFRVSPSTQNQALSALLFLYRDVLRVQLTGLDQIVRARRPARLPVVLTRDEVKALLSHLHGKNWLLASLLYGAGLRLLECLRLRIKDIDFTRNEILVRDGKGRKDRVTLLPQKIKKPLLAHIQRVQKQHQRDLENGVGSVQLPYAIERKYPRALWE